MFHPPVKDFSLLKALGEEEGRNLCVKPISVACRELQPARAPELWEGGQLPPPPPQPLSKCGGFLASATRQGWIGSCLSAAAVPNRRVLILGKITRGRSGAQLGW